MTGSFEKINYAIRPAKHAERSMIVELAECLRAAWPMKSYRYVGFGSPFFVDFKLVHRRLGIQHMVSIEVEDSAQARVEFNKPFKCIELAFGHSNAVLPTLDWSDRAIVWLDYDGQMDASVLADIRWVAMRAAPGSLLIVSVNVHPPSGANREAPTRFLERLGGDDAVPRQVSLKDMKGWGTGALCRGIFDAKVESTLNERNKARSRPERIHYRQLLNLRYQDGARMATFGGLLSLENEQERVESLGLEGLDFVRTGVEAFELNVPSLTPRETAHLDARLPGVMRNPGKGIPLEAAREYSAIYRHYPTFSSLELG